MAQASNPEPESNRPVGSETTIEEESPLTDKSGSTLSAPHVLISFAIGVGVVALAGLVTSLVLLSRPDGTLAGLRILAVTSGITISLSACGLLIGATAVLRLLTQLSEQTAQLEQHTAIQAEQAVASTTSQPSEPYDPSMLYELLADIQELLLLPDDQRERRFHNLLERDIQTGLADAKALAGCHDFHRARQELAALTLRFGDDERIATTEAEIEEVARQTKEADVANRRDDIRDLMALNQWEKAEKMARELADRYPDAAEPIALIEHVCRERQLFEQRYRVRMHDQIQQYVNNRQWQQAAEATRQFIETFAVGLDTDVLRNQLETLEANAEIQTRQQLEQEIKEHLQRQEYWDALAIARRIIADYPFSPQANVLRGQLARLEEKARNYKG